MAVTRIVDTDLIGVTILVILLLCGAFITNKAFSWMKSRSNKLKIPTFSDESDWSSIETQKQLTDALQIYGCCYYKMNKTDQELYNSIYPDIITVFEKTMKDETFVETLPKLRKYQSSSINYGYLDSFRKLSQVRAFVIPFEQLENNINLINDKNNPFAKNKKYEIYANSMTKHCQYFFNGILRSYFNKNGFNVEIDKESQRLIGNNPQKHLRLNFYDPLVSNNAKHINDRNGVKPHSDYGFITFLKASSPGFQILHKNKWIDVPYFEDRFCVNIGKALRITTNDEFKAVRHRVPIIEDKQRISLAFFYDPDLNGNLCQYQSDGKLKVLKDFQTYFYGDGCAMKSYKRVNKNNL